MPKAKAAPKKLTTKPVAPVPPPPPPVEPEVMSVLTVRAHDLPVIYDHLEIAEYSTVTEKGPLDPEWCKAAMGWETEKEYQARRMVEVPDTKAEQWEYKDEYHCKDEYGEKVRCKYNAHNRPYDDDWGGHLVATILRGQWAGPFTVPGETVNGETIRISRYGLVLSGQHQMTACIRANQRLQKEREACKGMPEAIPYPVWEGKPHCFIETIVVFGCSEDPRVLMTVDYVKPRTAADVFYTSQVFKDCTGAERKELCRILATAVDFLWTRTDARGYRTHPEVVGFLERHKKLLACTEIIFKENSAKLGRRLSKLRLSPGVCAAVCYLMGCSTDGDSDEYGNAYRNATPAPNEKILNWGNWDKAVAFWVALADPRALLPVRVALGRLLESKADAEDGNIGMGGRGPEKLAILAKAWEEYKHDKPFDMADIADGGALCLEYNDLDDKGNKLADGEVKLLDTADFLGIDWPQETKKGASKTAAGPMEAAPSREEIERLTAEARARRMASGK